MGSDYRGVQVCEETFDKKCSISFTKQASNETVEKCYRPLVRVCGDSSDDQAILLSCNG